MSVFSPGVCVSSALCVCLCVCVLGVVWSVFALCVWHRRLGIEELGSGGSEQSSQWMLLAASCMGLCLSPCVCVCVCVCVCWV